jgi:hypothetical protein
MQDKEVSLSWRLSGAFPELAAIALNELKRFQDETRKHFLGHISELKKEAAELVPNDDALDFISLMWDQFKSLIDLSEEFVVLGAYRTLERFLRSALRHLAEIGVGVFKKEQLDQIATQFEAMGVDFKKPPFEWAEINKLRTIRNIIAHDELWVDKATKTKLESVGLPAKENTWFQLPDQYFQEACDLVNRTCRLVVQECQMAAQRGKIPGVKPDTEP